MLSAGVYIGYCSMSLFQAELRRLYQRPALRLLIAAQLAIWGPLVFRNRDGLGGQLAWWSIYRTSLVSLHVALPLISSIAAGTSLVDDRSTGFVRFVLCRSVSHTRYLVAKYCAGAIVAAAVIALPIFLLALFALSVGPTTGTSSGTTPLPSSFPQSQLAVLTLFPVSAALGAAFFLSLNTLAALATKNRYIVVSLPLLVHLGLTFMTSLKYPRFNSFLNLQLEGEDLSPLSVSLFWILGIGVSLCLALAVAARREGLD